MEFWRDKETGKIITTERTRPNRISVRLTDEERVLLQKLVFESGMTQQEYMRKAILDKEIVNYDGIRGLTLELKRVGNNLNQIAKALNSGGRHDYDVPLNNCLKGLEEIWQLLRQYLQKQE